MTPAVAAEQAAPSHDERIDSPLTSGERIVMLLENNPYPRDVRVRAEAEALVRAGHRVTVVAPRERHQPRREQIAGVDVARFRLADGSARGAAGFVREYLVAGVKLNLAALRALAGGATVLHLHNPPDIFFPAGAVYRLAGRKVVFDHHDLFPETIELKLGAGAAAASRIASLCQGLTFAVANHVIATNGSYAEIACSAGAKKPEHVTIVRNAPPSAWTRMPIRHRPGRLGELRLAYVGAISSQDGVDGLAPVLSRVCEAVDARLTIIGDGDGRPALEQALTECGVADRVTFVGWVERERVVELIQEADVCVDPTPATWVNEHSTMIKMAEYLALGKPVVGYDLLEARRTAAGAALLVPSGDADAFAAALRRLAEDPSLREELSLKARNRALELTWDHSERALLGAYQALAEPARTGAPAHPAEGWVRYRSFEARPEAHETSIDRGVARINGGSRSGRPRWRSAEGGPTHPSDLSSGHHAPGGQAPPRAGRALRGL